MQNHPSVPSNDEKINNLSPLASGAQVRIAAKALGAAFSRDPFMSYVFPNAIARQQNITKVFLPLIRCNLRYGNVELAQNGNGILLWISGNRFPLTLSMLVHSGMIWTPVKIGLSAFKRLEKHEAFCDYEIESRAPQRYAYLWVVGVHPESAGKGFGKQMIQAALSHMQCCGHSACMLRTDNPKNVALYEHLGFKQIHTGIEPSSQLPFWILSRTL